MLSRVRPGCLAVLLRFPLLVLGLLTLMTWISSPVKARLVSFPVSSDLALYSRLDVDVVEYQAAFRSEADLRKFCDVEREAMMQCDGQGLINAMASVLPQVDKDAILGHADFAQYFGDSIHRGLATSCDGWIDDDFAFIQPWGFDLDEIKVPVLLYQGSEDKMVPFSHGKWLASHLPAEVSDAHFFQGQGHISIMLDHMDTMIEGLLKYC